MRWSINIAPSYMHFHPLFVANGQTNSAFLDVNHVVLKKRRNTLPLSLLILQQISIMVDLRLCLIAMWTRLRRSWLKWPENISTSLRLCVFHGSKLRTLITWRNNLSIKGWRYSSSSQVRLIKIWWKCSSPTFNSKVVFSSPESKVWRWVSQRRRGRMWLAWSKEMFKWERVKLMLWKNLTKCNTTQATCIGLM